MELNIPLILHAVLEHYALPWGGDHGIAHWARVYENGLRLAEETGAIVDVVRLFAVLHHSRRINEHTDPEHGPRAAEFARTLRGRLFDLPDHEFHLLHRACAGHTHERTHLDVTIQTCWDADRLDLGGSGSPRTRSTSAPRSPGDRRRSSGPTAGRASASSRGSCGKSGGSILGTAEDDSTRGRKVVLNVRRSDEDTGKASGSRCSPPCSSSGGSATSWRPTST